MLKLTYCLMRQVSMKVLTLKAARTQTDVMMSFMMGAVLLTLPSNDGAFGCVLDNAYCCGDEEGWSLM